jgi:hypothetical protein
MVDFEHLVATTGRLGAMTQANQVEMIAKIEANQEKMDTTQEKIKAEISSPRGMQTTPRQKLTIRS